MCDIVSYVIYLSSPSNDQDMSKSMWMQVDGNLYFFLFPRQKNIPEQK